MKQNETIIIIDDDPNIGPIIEQALGITSLFYSSPENFFADELNLKPVAFFIDVYLASRQNGLDLIAPIRKSWPYAVLIMISVNDDERLIEQVFALGADDFIRKPLRPSELKARLRYRVQQAREIQSHKTFTFGDLRLDMEDGSISGPKGKASLSVRESKMLAFLMDYSGKPIPRDDLKRLLWGNLHVTDNSLQRKIYETRQAINAVSATVKIKNKYAEGVFLDLSES